MNTENYTHTPQLVQVTLKIVILNVNKVLIRLIDGWVGYIFYPHFVEGEVYTHNNA